MMVRKRSTKSPSSARLRGSLQTGNALGNDPRQDSCVQRAVAQVQSKTLKSGGLQGFSCCSWTLLAMLGLGQSRSGPPFQSFLLGSAGRDPKGRLASERESTAIFLSACCPSASSCFVLPGPPCHTHTLQSAQHSPVSPPQSPAPAAPSSNCLEFNASNLFPWFPWP